MAEQVQADQIFGETNDEGTQIKYNGRSYIEDYDTFMSALEAQGGLMAAGEIGEMITRMSSYFSRHNVVLGKALKQFNNVAKEVYSQSDATGKAISAAKAEILASATPEAAAYQDAKIHVQNIEQNINALKALQRGVLNEYSHSAT